MERIEDILDDFIEYRYSVSHMTGIDAAVTFLDDNALYHISAQDLADLV